MSIPAIFSFTPHENSGTPLAMQPSATIFGYGAQGRAQARILHENGWQVHVVVRPGSLRMADAAADGLPVITDWVAAAREARTAALLIPDTEQAAVYREHLAPHLPQGAGLIFAHGYNIHFGQIHPRTDLDIMLVAPLASGETLRRNCTEGRPTPLATAVHQDATGTAMQRCRLYAEGLTKDPSQIIATTFREETETDLFSEQVLSCGGLATLIRTAFETLIAAGYSREIAYYTCLHEVKDLAALFAAHGLAGGFQKISTTARYGALTRGPRVINASVRDAMEEAITQIRDGRFRQELADEAAAEFVTTKRLMNRLQQHPIELMHQQLMQNDGRE